MNEQIGEVHMHSGIGGKSSCNECITIGTRGGNYYSDEGSFNSVNKRSEGICWHEAEDL